MLQLNFDEFLIKLQRYKYKHFFIVSKLFCYFFDKNHKFPLYRILRILAYVPYTHICHAK